MSGPLGWPRWTRVLAVARRERARSAGGRRGLSLLVFSLALLLPAGALPVGRSSDLPAVRGAIPTAMSEQVRFDERAVVELRAGPPLTVVGRSLPTGLRQALLQVEPTPPVELRLQPRTWSLPGRALLVALLAISMLTGPLAETLPGEREGRTLEILLASSLSRIELVLGKWLTWTLSSSAVALLASVAGLATGAIQLGPWVVAMPVALGLTVALGLWLVRGAGDLVGGAAVPMRILPVVALVGLGAAMGLSTLHPVLGGLVPLGGALAMASGLLPGALPALAALGSSALGTVVLVVATARALDQQGVAPTSAGPGVMGTVLAGGLLFALSVLGPGLFEVDGAPLSPPGIGLAAGGLLLGLTGLLALARRGELPDLGAPVLLPVGAIVGLLLAWTPELLPVADHPRFALAATPASGGALPVVLFGLGSGLWLRGGLQPRLGPLATTLVHVLVLLPLDPLRGLVLAGCLALLQRRLGLGPALAAHLVLAAAA